MKTDLYTKIVLTIIAVCLSLNLIKDAPLITTVEADTCREIYRVPIPINLVQMNGADLNREGGHLPVRVMEPVQVIGPVQVVEREQRFCF